MLLRCATLTRARKPLALLSPPPHHSLPLLPLASSSCPHFSSGLTTEGTQELCSWLITEARELAALVGQSDRLASIPFFLGATAGLRLLPYASRELIMSNTRGWLVTVANNPFLFSPLYAKILSGEEEAVFGWIAVNYLSNRFNGQSVGALDLGGASTQLTVDPRASIMESYFDYAGPYNRCETVTPFD